MIATKCITHASLMPACHIDQITIRSLSRSPMAPRPLSSFRRPTLRIYRFDPLPMAPWIQRDAHPTQPTVPVTVSVSRNHNEEPLLQHQAQFHQHQSLPLPSHPMSLVTPLPAHGTLRMATITHQRAPMIRTRRACRVAFPPVDVLSLSFLRIPSTHAHLPSLVVHLPVLLPSTAV